MRLTPRTGLWLMRCVYVGWGLMVAIALLMFVGPSFDPILSVIRLLRGALILDLLAMILLFARQRRWWAIGGWASSCSCLSSCCSYSLDLPLS